MYPARLRACPRWFAVSGSEQGAYREPARSLLRGHVGQCRSSQAAPGSQQRDRLQHVGLARTVFAHKQVELARALDPRVGVIAKMTERNAIERHQCSVGPSFGPAALAKGENSVPVS